jgi:signal transduction histidine kinase/CheY-like chemotaxis protein
MREVFSFFVFLASLMAALVGAILVALLVGAAAFFGLRFVWRRLARLAARSSKPATTMEELEAARARAEAASEAKSRLLATMSHEIRTPLNGMLGMSELLVATGLDLEQQSYVDAMRASGQALAAMIDEILDFSKLEAGKIELARAPFDLVDLVEGVVELLAPQAQNAGLEIASSIAPQLPTRFIGDAARLRQVLINLVGNAVKYTLSGGVGVRVEARDGAVEFTIIDTGPGIPPAHRDAIFEAFATGAHEKKPPVGSTGLGLSIARRLAEQMGGGLRLAETSEKGSRFVLRLPLVAASDAQPLVIPRMVRSKQALIVAASHFEAPYLAERLTAAGVELLWAASEEASQVFLRDAGRAGRPPDIIIVDCALGVEATRALADAARTAGVRQSLVFFSPSERRAFGQTSLQSFDGWLIKPLRVRSLYARLSMDSMKLLPPPAAAQSDIDLSGREVLLAEDNDINALIVTRHLEKRGARVMHVANGLGALEAAKEAIDGIRAAFDAIILDIRMPELDGIEAARRIRAAEREAGASPSRLITLSADAFEAAIEAAHSAGIDDFLTKPVDLTRLDRLLAETQRKDAA